MSLRDVGRGALLGASTGMRSLSGAATLAWGPPAAGRSGSTALRRVLLVAALAELAADKFPAVPPRTSAGPWGARVVLGGLTAGRSAQGRGATVWPSALAGAGAAFAATWAFQRARAQLAARIPDPAAAIAEDALAYVVAAAAVRI